MGHAVLRGDIFLFRSVVKEGHTTTALPNHLYHSRVNRVKMSSTQSMYLKPSMINNPSKKIHDDFDDDDDKSSTVFKSQKNKLRRARVFRDIKKNLEDKSKQVYFQSWQLQMAKIHFQFNLHY